ncbi:MAG TPA: LD-carboxypeptidase [Polyangia bacterium]|nr:LD-carboxypeptidase [Polyangia bacterium]
MSVVRSPRLRPGDVVRVVAPSGPVPRAGFLAGAEILSRRYTLRYDDGLFESEGYLAGSDERRLKELFAALVDPDARAVVMARGGYGLMRILPFLNPAVLAARPLPLVGFSDGTALLAYAARAGVAAVHGPVVTQLPNLPTQDHAALFRLLEEPTPGVLLDGLDELVPGRARGPLVGGNLEVFSRLVGTPYQPELGGAILFIEDLGERPYRVDRLITALDLAGVFGAIAGVVVGDFSACVEPEPTRGTTPPVGEVLIERLARLTIPVAVGGLFGHGTRNVALPHGATCELDTRKGSLIALEGVVS